MMQSEIIERPIDVEQRESAEGYSQESFLALIGDLHNQSIVYNCSAYDDDTLLHFYRQMADSFGVKVLSGELVKQFVMEMVQKNKQQLKREVHYYRTELGKLLDLGIGKISKGEFYKVVEKAELNQQIITDLLLVHTRDISYIDVGKIMEVLNQVDEQTQAAVPQLTLNDLKERHISAQSSSQSAIKVPDLQSSHLLGTLNQFEVNRLLSEYMNFWRRKAALYVQFITDQEIKDDISEVLFQVNELEGDLSDEVKHIVRHNQELEARGREFDGVVDRFREEGEIYTQLIEQQQSQINQLQHRLAKTEQERSHLNVENTRLEEAVAEVREKVINTYQQQEEMEEEMRTYRSKYEALVVEHSKTMEENAQQSFLSQEEENKRIFANRSIKEKLEDAVQRFDRIMREREKDKKMQMEKDEINQNTIDSLQNRIKQLQDQLKSKNQNLTAYIRESRFEASRASQMRMSKAFGAHRQSKLTIGASVRMADSVMSRMSSVGGSGESGFYRRKTNNNKTALTQINAIDEESEENYLAENSVLHSEQNIKKVIEQDEKVVEKELQVFKKDKEAIHNNPKAPSRMGYFMSKAILVNIYGEKFETTLLLTGRRLSTFDTKQRLKDCLPIQNIKCIILGKTNPNLVVIKPKNVHKLDQKKHITIDSMFFVRNRAEMVSFLSTKLTPLLQEHRIDVFVSDEADTFVKFNGTEYNLKFKVPKLYNPFRIALAGEMVFYVDLQEITGIFKSKSDAIMVVQPMGILCFEGNEIQEIDAKREFLYLLPITEQLDLKEKEGSSEAPGRKLKLDYASGYSQCFNVIFSSKEDLKKFKRAVKNMQVKNVCQRNALMNETNRLFGRMK